MSARRPAVLSSALNALFFCLILAGVSVAAIGQAHLGMEKEARSLLRPFEQNSASFAATFQALREQVTAEPCSPIFREQLRRVAYFSSGFGEFLYAPGGTVQCSVSTEAYNPPVDLGPRDFGTASRMDSGWFDRDLSFAGLTGLRGAIVFKEPFAILFPQYPPLPPVPGWIESETVALSETGRWWHRGGQEGIYEQHKVLDRPGIDLADPVLRQLQCMTEGPICVALRVAVLPLLWDYKAYFLSVLLGSLALSTWLARRVVQLIEKRWSFESRFLRNLDAGSIICAYQPILDLATGEIAGCEVLARWRDTDKTTVFPDRFIPLVEKHNLTLTLTRLVAERAYAELSETLPRDRRLNITFNIFPRDLDCAILCQIFHQFRSDADRFTLVVELVESDAIVVSQAQRQIEALRDSGIRTYIDDFGSGYSNIHNLAALAVDGVKLDRAFAMAPDGSLMDRMLGHAIEMVQTSGRVMVIEGVETAARLQQLRVMMPPIDFVQGYFISRPLDIAAFAAFLEEPGKDFCRRRLAA